MLPTAPVRFVALILALFFSCTFALAEETYVIKKKLSRHDVEPYLETLLSKAGDNLLKVYRVINSGNEATVFFRYHSRYGHTKDHQFVFVRDDTTDRWLDKERDTYLTLPKKPAPPAQ